MSPSCQVWQSAFGHTFGNSLAILRQPVRRLHDSHLQRVNRQNNKVHAAKLCELCAATSALGTRSLLILYLGIQNLIWYHLAAGIHLANQPLQSTALWIFPLQSNGSKGGESGSGLHPAKVSCGSLLLSIALLGTSEQLKDFCSREVWF